MISGEGQYGDSMISGFDNATSNKTTETNPHVWGKKSKILLPHFYDPIILFTIASSGGNDLGDRVPDGMRDTKTH